MYWVEIDTAPGGAPFSNWFPLAEFERLEDAETWSMCLSGSVRIVKEG